MSLYFKNFDLVRAIAASVVVIGHVKSIFNEKKIPNVFDAYQIQWPNPHLAVILFFVLSGFLITYLLKNEMVQTGAISFKKFYMRRIIRIWPVYYLVLILSFVFYTKDISIETMVLCGGIFPNIASALDIGWNASPQIWSIGVEEQFYLFWPLLLYSIKPSRFSMFLCFFFILYSLLPHLIGFIHARTIQNEVFIHFVHQFFYSTKFNSMAFGGLLGYLYSTNSSILTFLKNKQVTILTLSLTSLCWIFNVYTPYFNDEMYTIFFGLCLVCIANPTLNLNNRVQTIASFLGKISYGMYMYHWLMISLVIFLVPPFFVQSMIMYNILVYVLSLFSTIFVSYLSFISLEQFFLKKKRKFEVI